ncbi:MAG: glycosyl transferase [Alkaliphilus sp.]|nr:MAG: glycosyl transferase [Alkaliphilus sp.]
MKTIKRALTVRDSVFDETKRDDTLDLSNLTDKNIDVKRFFDETFITEGMKLLFDTAFKRFRGQSDSGIIKLTQAMGGGKTHNMLALGLLATNLEYRSSILGGRYKSFDKEIRVVAYTGRESDLNFGIWGEIARQLGKEELFNEYYSPLKAPGQTAWINLLKSDTPTLIILDELPPYLEYTKTQTYGTGTLLDITTNALSNLFTALNKEELYNVCLVISDLKATYQTGTQVIQGIFSNLDNELNRSSINIEPVSANTDDLYNILKTRLFVKTPTDNEIDVIALGYQRAVKEAKEMNYTDEDPVGIAKGIRTSYPFHPSIRDLFARFKENPGFQQTRGFIRLTRIMLKNLFKDGGFANTRYLINAFDVDFNDSEMVTMIKSIKPELSNAISHDIASKGNSVAEKLDSVADNCDMQDLTKLFLISSLSTVTGALNGLTINEAIAYIATPNRNITNLKKGLEELKSRAWYLYFNKENRLYFRKVQNVNAQLNDEIRGFTYEQAKLHIAELLKDKFSPIQRDCYQEVMVFPSIEEIELKKNKITLILTEPNVSRKGLKDELIKFYSDSIYKNRVMFLTGQRVAMDNLIEITKEYKAIKNIIYRMESEDKVSNNDSELIQARDLEDKITVKLSSNIRESFITLYFPKKTGLVSKDFKMEFASNQFDAEKQIKDLLIDEMKFTKEIEPKKLKNVFEARVFTQQRMTWNHILERIATETAWQWHKPEAIEQLRDYCLKRDLWCEVGGYIYKEPPAQKTSVKVIERHRDSETNEVILRISPINGDAVHYEIDGDATTASMRVKNLENFKTKELKLTFLCVDSSGKNKTGDLYEWKKDVHIKHREFDRGGQRYIEFQATSDQVEIRYSTDGSNPKVNGGKYIEPFKIPEGASFIQALAVNEQKGVYSDLYQHKVKEQNFVVDKDKPLKLNKQLTPTSTSDTYKLLEELQDLGAKVKGVEIAIQERTSGAFMLLSLGGFEIEDTGSLIAETNELINRFFANKRYEVTATINSTSFKSGQLFEQWVAKNKLTIEDFKDSVRQ